MDGVVPSPDKSLNVSDSRSTLRQQFVQPRRVQAAYTADNEEHPVASWSVLSDAVIVVATIAALVLSVVRYIAIPDLQHVALVWEVALVCGTTLATTAMFRVQLRLRDLLQTKSADPLPASPPAVPTPPLASSPQQPSTSPLPAEVEGEVQPRKGSPLSPPTLDSEVMPKAGESWKGLRGGSPFGQPPMPERWQTTKGSEDHLLANPTVSSGATDSLNSSTMTAPTAVVATGDELRSAVNRLTNEKIAQECLITKLREELSDLRLELDSQAFDHKKAMTKLQEEKLALHTSLERKNREMEVSLLKKRVRRKRPMKEEASLRKRPSVAGHSIRPVLIGDEISGEGGVVLSKVVNTTTGRFLVAKSAPNVDPEAEALRKVKREAELLMKFSHPNILRLEGLKTTGEVDIMYTELGDQGTLEQLIAFLNTLPEGLTQLYSSQLAGALACIHSQDTLHYNLKSSNILIFSRGYIKVYNFGQPPGNRIHTVPSYMAPEVLAEGMGAYTVQSEIWSYACVVYEMLHGELPGFSEKSPSKQIRATVSPEAREFLLYCFNNRPRAMEIKKHSWLEDAEALIDDAEGSARYSTWQTINNDENMDPLEASLLRLTGDGVASLRYEIDDPRRNCGESMASDAFHSLSCDVVEVSQTTLDIALKWLSLIRPVPSLNSIRNRAV